VTSGIRNGCVLVNGEYLNGNSLYKFVGKEFIVMNGER
jgi:hypothetical protein